MEKKIIKDIEKTIPRTYDEDGNENSKKKIAQHIYDRLPNPQRLDLQPFERYIPKECSNCFYNDFNKFGCTYDLYKDTKHSEEPAPYDCPLGH